MQSAKFNIAFLGDISLNAEYVELYAKKSQPFQIVGRNLREYTVVGNLECLSIGKDGVNMLKRPRLETNVETLNYVKDFHLRVACLANNHVFDHLDDGFNKTLTFLEQNQIRTTGASLNDDYKKPLILEKQGIQVGLLNYVTNDTHPNPPDDTKIKLNTFELESVIEDIKDIKDKVHHVVLSLHWGGRVEGGFYPDLDQPEIAHQLIDAGADLIIGHHSHTIQPFEVYKGKYIFYSLGNFCFSDFWFDAKYFPMHERRKNGLVVLVQFGKSNYQVNLECFKNENQKLIFNSKYLKNLERRNLYFNYLMKLRLWQLYYFQFKYVLPLVLFFKRDDLTFKRKVYRIYQAALRRLSK